MISQIIPYIRQKNVLLKNALIIAFLILSTIASATDYYISSSGNDTNNGLSSSTPWKTIAKVNSAFSIIKPGDRILFNRGDTFYGTLRISQSGSVVSPIIISAYGTGEKPVITGFNTLSSWTNENGNIYSKTVTCLSAPEIVTIDGVQKAMGRYPNTKWLFNNGHSGDISINCPGLNSSIINWTGAEVVQRKESRNIIDRSVITNHTGQTLTYSARTTGSQPATGWGYFIQNDLRTLDVFGEWYYNKSTSTFYMYFGSNNPNNYTVQLSTIDTLIYLVQSMNYITIDNISLKGANEIAITNFINNNVTVQNCDIDFSGSIAIVGNSAIDWTVSNNTINHSNDNGILFNVASPRNHLIENKIQNSGIIPGMGKSLFISGKGLFEQGDNALIEYNKIYNSGYDGMSFGGNNTVLRNNIIDTFCFLKDDGGGIYYGLRDLYSNMEVTGNIVLNGIGAPEGKPAGTDQWVGGIYIDYYSTGGVKINNNVIGNIATWGILISGSQNVQITNNTIFNSTGCMVLQELTGLGSPPRNINMNGNIFFAKGSLQIPLILNSTTNDFNLFGTFNNNYYAKPIDNSKPVFPKNNWSGTLKTLTEWQTLYRQDVNSHISSIALKDTADIDFYYNATKVNKTISLNQPMIDVKGTKYANSITLLPFTSVVLMVDPNPAQQIIPVYTGSVINNATPSQLEITYNVSLTNIVPATSAFTVQVNSIARTVNTVAISGTKIMLTLASAVVYGDIVTVTYTKPSSNPIQTSSGGQAITINAQPVVNNCINVAPTAVITSPISNSSFTASANIMITANASDPDGSVSIVEFYNGSTKLGSKSAAPYSFTWNNVAAGTYSLTVIAIDNLNAKTISLPISITVNNGATTGNQSPVIKISNPQKGNKFESPVTITIDAVAYDPDGTIRKVEFYSGAVKLFEVTSAPYTYTWKNVKAGTYSIAAIATDNLNATTTSSPVEIVVGVNIKYDADSKIINLYPNPNDGHFSIKFINPLQNDKSEIIINDLAGKQIYNGFVSKEETLKQFDLSNSNPGIYIMMIKNKEILVTKKIIKN